MTYFDFLRGMMFGAPRARTIPATVPLSAGTIYTVDTFGLQTPITYAKTGGNSNLTVGASTGAIAAATALTTGETQSITGTATGADACVVPFTANLTGQTAAPTAPGKPTLGAAVAGDGTLTFPWVDGSTGGSPITKRYYSIGTDASGEGELIAATITNGNLVITGLLNGTKYYVEGWAQNAIGYSVSSNEVSGVPGNLIARNIASSVAIPGHRSSPLSNDNTHNTWSGHINYSGSTAYNIEIGYTGTGINGTNEYDLPNAYTVKALVEYPIGSGTTFLAKASGVDGVTINPGAIEVLAAMIPSGIPAGAPFRIKAYITCVAGGKIPTSLQMFGAAAPVPMYTQSGSSLTDQRNTTGTPFDGTYAYALVPAFIRSVEASNSKSFGLFGMSLVAGQNDDQQYPAQDGYSGGYARGMAGYPLVQGAYPGTRNDLQAGNFSRRAALIHAAGLSHCVCSWEVNDLVQTGDTAATIMANMDALSAQVAAAGAKPIWCTVSPYVNTTTDYFLTAGSTPYSSDWSGAGSRRGLVNAAIRAKHGSIYDYIEINTQIEVAQDDGRFADYSYNRTNGPNPPEVTVGAGATTKVIPTNYSGGQDSVVFTSGGQSGAYRQVSGSSGSTLTLLTDLGAAPASGDTLRALRGYYDKTCGDGLHWSRTYHAMVAGTVGLKMATF